MATRNMNDGPRRFSRARAGVKRGWPLLAALCLLLLPATAPAQGRDRPTPSGYPVPRWISLKYDKVNARSGPGDDYPAVWTYRAKGLPLQVTAETREWRKVCDPDGGSAWVHKRTTDGVRTVFHRGRAPLPMRASAKADAPVRALLAPRGVGRLDRCDKGWCAIRVGRARGWIPASGLWGVAERRVCR